jgi:hypothetical protein
MLSRSIFAAFACAVAACGQVKTKLYLNPEGCVKTYHLAAGRVLTSRGLIEDPTVNAIMKKAVSVQMKELNIAEVDKGAEVEVRFMGGNGAGLQTDDPTVGDVAVWALTGTPTVSGKTYKKSTLVLGIVDSKSNRTLWTARCSDNFGDPARLEERIQKAVAKAFAKFPKSFSCGGSSSGS